MAGEVSSRATIVGEVLGHYCITEKIGEGGMGEVYRARDQRLDRDVAIKVLPQGTLGDESARRNFRNEALALSKLNHPHIETIHDFDSQQSRDFIVTEFIPGEGMDEKLAGGALPEKDMLRWGAQLAEGLAAAHEQNIIHRDLKPSNLRITRDGRLKILDFGLAKLTMPVSFEAATASLGESLRFAGTLPYMAPEQVRGEKLDERTDIWAAGAVLYEMATGSRPFRAAGLHVIDQILHEAPEAPSSVIVKVSNAMETIILKCLEKEPEHRYQSVEELLVDLRRLARPAETSRMTRRRKRSGVRTAVPLIAAAGLLLASGVIALKFAAWRNPFAGAAAPAIRSVAVLPLENLSGDPNQDYFVDGMHEELIATLGTIRSLSVISRTSVMQYKGTRGSLKTMARELGVDAVIEGSVRRAGDQVRVTVELIEGATDRNLWSGSYQREVRDILALQGEVASSIAQGIRIAVTPDENRRLAKAYPVSIEAQDAYLKGRFYWNKRTTEDLEKARQFFQKAVELDPNYALGYAGLADAFYIAAARDFTSPREAYAKAKAAATHALELDDSLAEAHTSLGGVSASSQDWLSAEREYKRAIELNPSYATAHHWYSIYLSAMGRFEEARSEITRARELDPLSLIIRNAEAWPVFLQRRYDEAIQQYQQTLLMDPKFLPAYLDLGRAYLYKGRLKEAVAVHLEFDRLSGEHPTSRAELSHTYAMAGRRGSAVKILKELIGSSNQAYVSPYDVARIYTALGDKDQALKWLDKAFEEHSPSLRDLRVDPDVDPLRSEPHFQERMRKLNFPQ